MSNIERGIEKVIQTVGILFQNQYGYDPTYQIKSVRSKVQKRVKRLRRKRRKRK